MKNKCKNCGYPKERHNSLYWRTEKCKKFEAEKIENMSTEKLKELLQNVKDMRKEIKEMKNGNENK